MGIKRITCCAERITVPSLLFGRTYLDSSKPLTFHNMKYSFASACVAVIGLVRSSLAGNVVAKVSRHPT